MRRLCHRLSTASRTLLVKPYRSYSTGLTQRLVLRPYQEECIQACLKALYAGRSRIAVSLPTGSGKTVVYSVLLSRIPPPVDRPSATRALVIVGNVEIARQSVKLLHRLFPSWSVEIEQGGNRASGRADVTIAMYQSLIHSNMYRMEKYDPRFYKVIIVDEAHHAAADSYLNILSKFHKVIEGKYSKTLFEIPIVGFSATLTRSDNRSLKSIFSETVFNVPLIDLIHQGWLCNLRCAIVLGELELDERVAPADPDQGDFHRGKLATLLNTPRNNQMIIQSWREKAAGRRSTLVFCVDIDHTESICKMFRDEGIDARFVHSQIAMSERDRLLDSFKAGKFPVLVNCGVVMEGVDIPRIDTIVMARPTLSRLTFKQMIGRGTRLSPETGKKDCLVIIAADSSQRALHFACLLDSEELGPAHGQSTHPRRRRSGRARSRRPRNTVHPSENMEDLQLTYMESDLLTMAGKRYTAQSSKYAWINCGDGLFVLNTRAANICITTEMQDGKTIYVSRVYRRSESNDGFETGEIIYRGESLKDAAIASERWVESDIDPRQQSWLLRSAEWRKERASRQQLTSVARLLSRRRRDRLRYSRYTSPMANDLARLTKGAAVDILTVAEMGDFMSKRRPTARPSKPRKISDSETSNERNGQPKDWQQGPPFETRRSLVQLCRSLGSYLVDAFRRLFR